MTALPRHVNPDASAPRPARKRAPLRHASIAVDDATATAIRALRRAHELTTALAQTAGALKVAHIADAAAHAAGLVDSAGALLAETRVAR